MTTGNYKVGNEFLPYHASASHTPPDFRDGWNACYSEAQIRITELSAQLADAKNQGIPMKTKELVLHDGVDDGRGGRVCRLRFHDDIVGMVANAKARKLLHNVITFKNNYNCSFFYISSKFAQADFDAANDVGKINIINASALFNIAALPRDDEDLVLAAKNASGNYALKVVEIPLDFEYNILSSLDGEIVSEKHRIFK